jgi:hypothetical protein
MYEPNAAQKSDTRILYLKLPFLNLTVSDINKHKKHYTYTVFQILGILFLLVKLTLNNEGNMLFRNVENFVPDDVPSHRRYRNLVFRSYLLKPVILRHRAYTNPPV